MVDYLLNQDLGFELQEDGLSRFILDDTGSILSTPPSNPVSALLTIPNNIPAFINTVSHIATIPYVYLTWTASGNGSAFAYYEIQRVDEDGSVTIAYLLSESLNHFGDFMVKHGVSTSWRIRSVLRTGDVSSWVNFTARTIPISDRCAVYIVNNTNPLLNVAMYDEPGLTYTTSTADNVTLVEIEGRDTPVGFIAAEAGGDIVTRTFTVGFNDNAMVSKGGTVRGGRAVFTTIKQLLQDSQLAGIAVLDGNSDRMYATARITGMKVDQPGERYHISVEFHETATPDNAPILTSVSTWAHS